MPAPRRVFRADHVGSFIRPDAVLKARAAHFAGELDAAGLRAVEDEEIAKHVRRLVSEGVQCITDGEFRRQYFHLDFLKHIDGVVEQFNTLEQKEGHKPPTLAVTAKIAWPQGGIEVRNFEFLKSLLPPDEVHRIKITMPSPTMLLRGGRQTVSTEAYPDLADFYDDLVAVYRAEIDALYQAGCRYIQFDDTNLAYLTDPTMRQQQRDAGEDVDTLPARYVALINRCISPRPDDLTTATHVCKGNFKSTYFALGSSEGYAPIAKELFGDCDVDAFFLEWEDERRSGADFSALKPHLPAHKMVVLGLVSTKVATMEDKATLVAKMRAAAEMVPAGLEQLGISGQCGFSSTVHPNAIDHEQQFAKLRLCREVAEELYGPQS